jgi:hypothetical protein
MNTGAPIGLVYSDQIVTPVVLLSNDTIIVSYGNCVGNQYSKIVPFVVQFVSCNNKCHGYFVVASQNENEINISQRYHFVLGGSNYSNISIKKT